MVPRETVSFVFPRVLMFPCFVIYLDFPLNNHVAKATNGVLATTAQLYPGRDTFELYLIRGT